eukprot:403347976
MYYQNKEEIDQDKSPLLKDSNMQYLEGLLQSRKSLEVKKIQAMIDAAGNRQMQDQAKHKFDLIRNSLDFQMNQVLNDVDKKKEYKDGPNDDSGNFNVQNLRNLKQKEPKISKNKLAQQTRVVNQKESLLRQSRDFVSQSISSNSFIYESDDEDDYQDSKNEDNLRINLISHSDQNQTDKKQVKSGLALRMQRQLRDRENNALRLAKKKHVQNHEAQEKKPFKQKFRDFCQNLKYVFIDREALQKQQKQEEIDLDYSTGEDESEFDVPFQFLAQKEKNERSMFLWNRGFLKARGGAKILEKFAEIHRKIMIFGTTKNINYDPTKEEREAFLKKKPFILLPDSTFKKFWNFVIVFLLAYTASFVPVKTAFFDEDPEGLYEFELFLDCLFYLDLFIQFISAYEDQNTGFIEVRFNKIARSYITSWFLMDLTACIPFQQLSDSSQNSGGKQSSNVKLLRLTRLPRLYRLLRILRLFKMFSLFKYNKSFRKYIDALKMNQGMMRMVQVTGGVFFMVHLMACFWFLSAKFNDFEWDCWVMQRGIEDQDDGYQYLTSVYWALQTITTVGYGDIPAKTQTEQILSIMWMVFGVGFYSFTIGNLSSVIASMDTKNSILKQKLTTLGGITYPWKYYLRDKFFQDKNPDFLWQVLPLLKNMKIYKGDILYSQGDHADERSVVMHIDLNDPAINPHYQPKEKKDDEDEDPQDDAYNVPFNLYVEGSYFGDSDCLFQRRLQRECMAEAEQECHLLVMKKGALEELLEQFQDIKNQMTNIANEKRKYHRRLIQELLRKHKEQLAQECMQIRALQNRESSPEIMKFKSLKRRKTFKNKNGTQSQKNCLQIPIITYSEGMKHVINQFKDKKQENQLKLPPINQIKAQQEIKKKSQLEEKLENLEREAQKLEILHDSEAYYQKNLNAFNNNMSLLALNTYEISQLMSNLNRDNQQILSIAQNIQVHTSFMARKSEDLKRKVLILADRVSRNQNNRQQQ